MPFHLSVSRRSTSIGQSFVAMLEITAPDAVVGDEYKILCTATAASVVSFDNDTAKVTALDPRGDAELRFTSKDGFTIDGAFDLKVFMTTDPFTTCATCSITVRPAAGGGGAGGGGAGGGAGGPGGAGAPGAGGGAGVGGPGAGAGGGAGRGPGAGAGAGGPGTPPTTGWFETFMSNAPRIGVVVLVAILILAAIAAPSLGLYHLAKWITSSGEVESRSSSLIVPGETAVEMIKAFGGKASQETSKPTAGTGGDNTGVIANPTCTNNCTSGAITFSTDAASTGKTPDKAAPAATNPAASSGATPAAPTK